MIDRRSSFSFRTSRLCNKKQLQVLRTFSNLNIQVTREPIRKFGEHSKMISVCKLTIITTSLLKLHSSKEQSLHVNIRIHGIGCENYVVKRCLLEAKDNNKPKFIHSDCWLKRYIGNDSLWINVDNKTTIPKDSVNGFSNFMQVRRYRWRKRDFSLNSGRHHVYECGFIIYFWRRRMWQYMGHKHYVYIQAHVRIMEMGEGVRRG